MLVSYLKLALRNLVKHRLYALINIGGLALGLTIFVFSHILLNYENNHDNMFSKRDRIFLVGSIFSPTYETGIREMPNVRSAYGPLFDLEIEEAEHVARSLFSEHVLSINKDNYRFGMRFVDPGYTRIFDFQYLYGDSSAIDDPHGIIITASTAKKIFGRVDVLAEVLQIDHQYEVHITGVIEDVDKDTHLNSSLIPDSELTIIASLEALVSIQEFDLDGDWKGFAYELFTYIYLEGSRDSAWLSDQVNAISKRHAPDDEADIVQELKIIPLAEMHKEIWKTLGFPLIQAIRLLGFLVLIIACVNYTNLATAQSFGRTREIGLRLTFGAKRSQLLLQFLVESLTTAVFAMLLAIACIEILVPVYNTGFGKVVGLDYISLLPWLITTTLLVGLIAGAYPAYLISRLNPIDSLRNSLLKGRKGSIFRGLMVGVQFTISIFILAMVMIIYFQNEKVQESSNIYPKSQIVLLEKINTGDISEKLETLRRELNTIEGIQSVTFSSGIPFWQGGQRRTVTPISGDETLKFYLSTVSVDIDFMKTYDIDLLSGRPFNLDIAHDKLRDGVEEVNVIVNLLTLQKLGFFSEDDLYNSGINNSGVNSSEVNRSEVNSSEHIGKIFFKLPGERSPNNRQYTIIGVMPDQNFRGLFNKLKPIMFFIDPSTYSFGSIRVSGGDFEETLDKIDLVWDSVITDFPIQRIFLDDMFNYVFRFFKTINYVLASFSAVALALALIGLFGLAAFMAQRRTKEIGIRKVMGANVNQIVLLLVWQFSLPVMWSLLLAIPLAYLASNLYLDIFTDRITFVVPIVLLASAMGIITAWVIVAGHAIKIARANPIRSLRYE